MRAWVRWAILSMVALFGLQGAYAGPIAPVERKPGVSAKWKWDPAALQPFWRTDTMRGETVLFAVPDDGGPARANLLMQPTRIVRVRSASGAAVYRSGRDYVWHPGSREITIPAGSRIPVSTRSDLRRAPGTQQFALTHRDGTDEILFGATHEYQDRQTVVTYRHDTAAWTGPRPVYAGDRLPHTMALLRAHSRVTVALLGDSISTGCNASGWCGVAPFQPAWQDLFVSALARAYRAPVALRNFAVGGTDTDWGVRQIGQVADAAPDLVILAFGMNDAGGRPADAYGANLRAMIDAVRKARPAAEFVLVATMVGNREWTYLKQDLFRKYRDALAALCGPGVVLADMTSMWQALLAGKLDRDMTGNGVNHPNDFGHRIYAQVLTALTIPDPAD